MPSTEEFIVRQLYKRIDAQDFSDTTFAVFAVNVRYQRIQPWDKVVPIEGRCALQEFYKEVRDIEGVHEILAISQDSALVVDGRFQGTRDGNAISFLYTDMFWFDANGLIVDRHSTILNGQDEV